MPSKPHVRRRRAHRAQLRERIVDAARALFAIGGADAVTMRAIGQRSRYTTSAIYKHFANKDAVLAELRRDAVSRLALAMTAALEAAQTRWGGPLAALRGAARGYLAFATSDPHSYALAFGRGAADATPIIEAFAELLARRRSESEIGPFDRDLALVLWCALHGRATLASEIRQDNDSFVDLCLNLLPLGVSE